MPGIGAWIVSPGAQWRTPRWVGFLLAIALSAGTASAELVMQLVEVGDPGNPENTIVKKDGTSGYGAVDYVYRIGAYEVTNSQYVEFLNAVAASDPHGLYSSAMTSFVFGGIVRSGTEGNYTYSVKPNMGDKPVNYVSWFDGARFANWLHNGQPVGPQDASTTEDGAYTFTGLESVSRRNSGARFFMPNEHEWEKATYYEPGAITELGDGWWKRPTRTDVFPTPAQSDATGHVSNPGPNIVVFRNMANWNGTTKGNVMSVGSAGNETYYGAHDMGGNVFEWVTADPEKPDPEEWGPYTVRGGSFASQGHVHISERNHPVKKHNVVSREVGLRIAAAPALLLGDMDYDGAVGFDDIAPFVLALRQPAAYEDAYGWPGSMRGDINGDGRLDFDDIDGFRGILAGDASSLAVPEPASLPLMVLCGLLLWLRPLGGGRRTP